MMRSDRDDGFREGLNPSYGLHDKSLIENPAGKVKSVVFTDEGLRRAKELFETMFAKKEA